MNRQQLDAEWNAMIRRIEEMTSENEKIINKTAGIILASKPSDEELTRADTRVIEDLFGLCA